jgi:hypothetical protein
MRVTPDTDRALESDARCRARPGRPSAPARPPTLLGCAREDADILLSFLLGVLIALGLIALFVSGSVLMTGRIGG